ICTASALPPELEETLLGREETRRKIARNVEEALAAAAEERPNLMLVDSALENAEGLIGELRRNLPTRSVSIAVVTQGDFDPLVDVRFLEAGANTILRLPVTSDWDDRIAALLSVAPRRTARLAATLQFEGTSGDGGILTVAGTVLNLSEHGMLVETDIDLPIGTDLDFRIHLRDQPTPLVGCGQIVRQQSVRRNGIRFYGLEADGADRVRRFVEGS